LISCTRPWASSSLIGLHRALLSAEGGRRKRRLPLPIHFLAIVVVETSEVETAGVTGSGRFSASKEACFRQRVGHSNLRALQLPRIPIQRPTYHAELESAFIARLPGMD
jgi:hypothetical protein